MAVLNSRQGGTVRRPGPSDYALAQTVLRFTIALRAGGVAAAITAATLGEGAGISRAWQVAVLGGLAVWVAIFTATALRYGLRPPMVAADSGVICLALLAQPKIVPTEMLVDETTWAIMLASTAIYVAQLALGQIAALVLSAVVITAYVAGAPATTSLVRILFVQAVVVNAIMWLLRRGGGRADALVAERDRERQRMVLEAARRADERHYRSQMHDSVLATLTMVASGAVQTGSPGLRRGARRALEVMEDVSAPLPAGQGPQVDLVADLAGLVTEMSAEVAADLIVAPSARAGPTRIEVPEVVASAITGAVGEALRNVARHAGVSRASVHAGRHGAAVTVTVADQGRGFDQARVPADRSGIRCSMVERMAVVGGTTTVESRPRRGTVVTVRWAHG
ncbi:sensor histidine kinase [Actinomadura macra]|uniref:sensor histidine kinase n=1 Tax=Actinomadura macra TaxID=46164 RepID=UPI00082C3C36|nr:ATP-binding protein [Actinomadura macra]